MSLEFARVIQQDAERRRLIVMTGLSSELLEVKVGHVGAFDGQRISQKPLPGRGTMGLIGFPYGDIRSAVWICSLDQNLQDAITSADGEPFDDYEAAWSGYWRLLTGSSGAKAEVFPDGTEILVGQTSAPATYRHVVGEDQAQQRIEITQSDRVPSPPSGFPLQINHASGTKIGVASAGAVSVAVASGQTLQATANGATIEMDASGNISASAVNTLTLSAAGHTLEISSAGIALDGKIFATHEHTDVQSGTSNTGPVA